MRVLVPGCCQEPRQNCSHHRTSLDILCAPYWSVINLDSHRLAVYRTIHALNLQTSAGSPANQETRIYKTVRNDPPRKPDSRINTRRRSHRTPHPPSLCTRPYSDKPPLPSSNSLCLPDPQPAAKNQTENVPVLCKQDVPVGSERRCIAIAHAQVKRIRRLGHGALVVGSPLSFPPPLSCLDANEKGDHSTTSSKAV